MKLPNVIGLAGQKGVGKDTAAAWFVERGYTRSGFSDPLKFMLNQAFGWSMNDWEDREWKEATCVVTHGAESFLPLPCPGSPRHFAQWLGTEVVRNNFGQNAWVDLWKQKWHSAGQPRVIVPDVRFQNEVDAIHSVGGIVIRITRGVYDGELFFAHDGELEHRPHDSERTGELRNIDHHIENNGTVAELHEALGRLLA